MTINERFVILLKTLNISVKDASVMLGKSEGYVRKLMRTGESFGIEPVLAILNSIDSISADWLLTGKGDMIKDNINDAPETPCEDSDGRLLSIVESQQRIIELQASTIEALSKK